MNNNLKEILFTEWDYRKNTNLDIRIKNKENTSFPEQATYFYVSKIFEDAINSFRFKYGKKRFELDIYIQSLKLGIEYDGSKFHSSNKAIAKDEDKNEILKEKGVNLIRIREKGCPKINMFNHFLISTSRNRDYSKLDKAIKDIFNFIKNNFNLTPSQINLIDTIKIDTKQNQLAILQNFKCKKIEKSLEVLNPALAAEWHPTKNGNLSPSMFSCGANVDVWWLCKEGHNWIASINSRNSGVNCPYCCNNKVCKDNCLATVNPKLASEWHPTKNGNLTPFDVLPNSKIEVWWKCKKNPNHEWLSNINNRNNHRGCPFCNNRKVDITNCLATSNPELASEWHPSKNGTLTPYDVSAKSHKKVWWKCINGHEWPAPIFHRNNPNRNNGRGTKCNYCRIEHLKNNT